MRRFEFSRDVLAEIERDRFAHPDPLVQRRMEVLWLKSHGETHERIAELATVSRATVQRLLDSYEAGGVQAVQTFHWRVPVSALAPHRPQLEAEFRERPPHTVVEACMRIEQLIRDRALSRTPAESGACVSARHAGAALAEGGRRACPAQADAGRACRPTGGFS